MPALNITSVDPVTDQLTIPAHGLNTGDGPAAIRRVGNGAPPTPLAPVTDYWIIRDDADRVRLAESRANAMAGIAIDITGSYGSASLILEIGIPYRRARTYVPSTVDKAGAQVKSGDLNAMQRSWEALHALLTGQPQSVWEIEPIPIIIPGARAMDPAGVHNRLIAPSGCHVGYTLAANTAPLTYPIDNLRDGDIITAWFVSINKVSGGTGAYQGWVKSHHAGTYAEADESDGTGILSAEVGFAGGLGESGLGIKVDSAKQYYLDVDPSAACTGDAVYRAIVWVKRPRL